MLKFYDKIPFLFIYTVTVHNGYQPWVNGNIKYFLNWSSATIAFCVEFSTCYIYAVISNPNPYSVSTRSLVYTVISNTCRGSCLWVVDNSQASHTGLVVGQCYLRQWWVSAISVSRCSVWMVLSPPSEVVGSAVLGQSLMSTLVTIGILCNWVPNQLLLCIGATFVVLVSEHLQHPLNIFQDIFCRADKPYVVKF